MRILWSRTAWREFQLRHPAGGTLVGASCGGVSMGLAAALTYGTVGHVLVSAAAGVIGAAAGQRLRYRFWIKRSAS